MKVELVPTTNIVLNWAQRSEAQEYDQRLSSITAFSGVTMASHVPLGWGAPTRELIIDGVATAPGEKPPRVSYLLTGSNYFALLNLPIARGRGIEAQDARPGQEADEHRSHEQAAVEDAEHVDEDKGAMGEEAEERAELPRPGLVRGQESDPGG